nr:reverse transcriptase domain-containing protein [Tanacetum cinerariifolium]
MEACSLHTGGSNHVILSNLSKSPIEILATEKVAKTFEQPPRMVGSKRSRDMSKYFHFHEDYRHETNQCRELKHQIKEAVKSGIGEITFPSVTGYNNSSDLVIIKAQIFGREVNRIVSTRRFLGRTLLASRRGSSRNHNRRRTLSRIEVLNFVIVRANSPHNLLLGRTAMQKIGLNHSMFDQLRSQRVFLACRLRLSRIFLLHRALPRCLDTFVVIHFQLLLVMSFPDGSYLPSFFKDVEVKLKGVSPLLDLGVALCAPNTCDRGKGLRYTEYLEKEWEYSFSELLLIIKDDYLRSFELAYNVFPYKLLHMFSFYGYQSHISSNFDYSFGVSHFLVSLSSTSTEGVLAKKSANTCPLIELHPLNSMSCSPDSIAYLATRPDFSGLARIRLIDGASSSDSSSAGLMLVSPEGKEYTYALKFEFETTNNKAEYETLLAGLRIIVDLKVRDLSIFVDSQLVANQVNDLFEARQPVIKQYLDKTKEVLESFNSYSMEDVRRYQNKKADALSKLASMTFSRLAKEILVLWAHRATPKSSNGETPFSLTYGSKAIVPIEISMEMIRIKEFKSRKNDKIRREDLNILEERRKVASIREAHYKQKLEMYYNKRIRTSTFKPVQYRKKVNSRCVMENVLMGYGGAYVRNKGDKREGLCEVNFRLGDGLKIKSMKVMMFRMKSKD